MKYGPYLGILYASIHFSCCLLAVSVLGCGRDASTAAELAEETSPKLQPEESNSIELTGRLIDLEGRPLSSIVVALEEIPSRLEAARAALVDPSRRTSVSQTLTDDDGEFVLSASRGVWRVVASGQGRVAKVWHVGPLAESRRLPTVSLLRDVGFVVEIRDDRGRPLSGVWARVHNATARARKHEGWLSAESWSQTNAKGRAQLAWTGRAGDKFEVRVPYSGPGGAPLGWHTERRSIHHGGRLSLPPLTTRTLLVSMEGKPPRDVFFESSSGSVAVADAKGVIAIKTSDPDGFVFGSFLLDGIALPWSGLATTEEPPHTVELPPVAPFEGQILTATGEPLPGACVTQDLRRCSWTDSEGIYRWPISRKKTNLRVYAAGYRTGKLSIDPAKTSQPHTLNLALDASVVGRLIDEKEEPIVGAKVTVFRAHPDGWTFDDRKVVAISDRLGRIVINRLEPETKYRLRFEAPGFVLRVAQVTLPSVGQTLEKNWTLFAGSRLSGRVRHVRDPVPGARLKLTPNPRKTEDLPMSWLAAIRYAESEEDGDFLLSGIKAGTYDLEIRAEGRPRLERKGIAIGEAEELNLGDLGMSTGTSKAGIVLSTKGKPIEGALITAFQSGFRPTVSGRQGRFRVNGVGLEEQPDKLRVTADGWVPGMFPVGQSRIVLRPQTRVAGRLVDRDGRPVYGARLKAFLRSDRSSSPNVLHVRSIGSTFLLNTPSGGALSFVSKTAGMKLKTSKTVHVTAGNPVYGIELVVDRLE